MQIHHLTLKRACHHPLAQAFEAMHLGLPSSTAHPDISRFRLSGLSQIKPLRDDNGRPRQRTVSTLGRLDEVGGQVDSLLKGLLRAKGMPAAMAEPPQLAFESALALGDV